MSWLDKLEAYLFEANLDDALKFLLSNEQSAEAYLNKESGPRGLYARSLICEVLDYAGLWRQATRYIGDHGKKAYDTLCNSKTNTSLLSNLRLTKQQCWCCLHLGMVQYYREQQWAKAREHFEAARMVLEQIARVQEGSCFGSLSRAYYCLGLVAREEHDYITSRQHFSKSIEFAGKKLGQSRNEYQFLKKQSRQQHAPHIESQVPTKFFAYCLAKSAGLGMSWLAYTRGSMSEAFAHLVSARQLLPETGARYIRSYIEVVHATAKRAAAADDEKELREALRDLSKAYVDLGGDAILTQGRDHDETRGALKGHRTYAIRAAIELATAHLTAARLGLDRQLSANGEPPQNRSYLKEAMDRVKLVLLVLTANPQRIDLNLDNPQAVAHIGTFTTDQIADPRTYCNALILGSRILREMGHELAAKSNDAAAASKASQFYRHAVHAAESAASIVKNDRKNDQNRMHFSYIDSSIACGEAYFYSGDHKRALEYFEAVADDQRARTNPKVVAVAELLRARCYLRLGLGTRAREIFQSWEGYGRLGNENAYIRNLEAVLNYELENHHGTLCLEPDRTLQPLSKERLRYWRREVLHWFAHEAIRIVKNDEDITDDDEALRLAAMKLRMAGATLKRWRDKKSK